MKALEVLNEIIINAAIAQGFVMAFLFRGGSNRIAHLMLSLLLIDLSLIVFRVHYLMYPLFDILGTHFFITGPFLLLLGPFLFFYMRSIVQPGRGIDKSDFKHFIIFGVYVLFMISIVIAGPEGSYYDLIKQVIGSPWVFLVVQLGFYLATTNKMLKQHRANMINRYSNVEGMDASWLQYIIWVFVIIMVFVTIAIPSLIHGVGFDIYKTTSSLFYSVILFFIGFKGIRQKIPMEQEIAAESMSGSPDEQMAEQKKTLLTYLESQRPYLNPELSLIDLAQQLDMSRNQLSSVINNGMGDNFYNFINGYRVEEVKRLIQQDAKRQYKIMTLASQAGFNSKSSFNKIFKEITGLTPSEYRKTLN